MAGFMSGPLGFSSTIGAAIGGAAKQGNELFAEQRAQDRQNEILQDQVWANKFDNGQKEYNQNKVQRQNEADVRNSFLTAAKGNEQLADTYFGLWKANPKQDLGQLVQSLNTAASSSPSNPDYKSPFQGRQAEQEAFDKQHLQSLYGRLSDKFKQKVGPLDNFFNGGVNSGSWQPNNIPQTQGNPQMGLPASPSYAVPTGNSPSSQSNSAPIYKGQSQGNASQYPNITLGGNKANPIIQDIAKGVVLEHLSPEDRSRYVNALQDAQRTGDATKLGEVIKTLPNMTPYQKEELDIQRQKLDKETNPDTILRNKNIEANVNVATDYFKNPKIGLEARYQQIGDLRSQSYGMQSIMGMLNRGFQASNVQPFYDELNRFVKPLTGVDLSELGIANNYSDISLMKKDAANAIIDRLKTLHFGRITNYEAQMVKQGFSNSQNDPNTNMKIALTFQSLINKEIQNRSAEYDAAHHPSYRDPTSGVTQLVKASNAGKDAVRALDKNTPDVPWMQVNGNNPKDAEKVAAIPQGVWFEDTSASNGTMYIKDSKGVLRRAGDVIQ